MDLAIGINLAYVVASVLFIFGLKMMSRQASAKRGNFLSGVGMLIAIVATLVDFRVVSYEWIIGGAIIGSIIGYVAAKRVEMTAMPEMVALFNGSGGLSSLLVGWAALYDPSNTTFANFTIALSILIGGVTATGSLIAYLKLAEKMNSKAIVFAAQRIVNAAILVGIIACSILLTFEPTTSGWVLFTLIGLALLLGVMAVIPIGGADMPVVISLLNSYSGLAACAAGFAINNNVLIVAGALVGASGIILTQIMCKAMNRSLANVLFSGFGAVKEASKVEGVANPISIEDAYVVLEAAQNVMFIPGYGMAVAQAQHAVRELSDLLQKNGAEVNFAIHPVAGRMPGHMNVLLAEASVPYEQLLEMDDVNPRMENCDVAIVIGANDTVNPAAIEDPNSPIAGMPIIEAHRARTTMVLKRSMASGFSGVDNPLFFKENTRMLFGDAKASISALVAQFKGAH